MRPRLIAESYRGSAESCSRIEGFGDHPEDNLLIHGDAPNALEALTQQPRFTWRYAEKVKLAYLDPPFNTA